MNVYNIVLVMLRSFLDVFIVTTIIYFGFTFMTRSKKHILVTGGIGVFILVYALSNLIGLKTLSFILSQIYSWGFIIIFILFQNEIRNGLEKISMFNKKEVSEEEYSFVDELTETVYRFSENKTGALITIEKSFPLNDYTKNAVKIDAKFSKYLMYTIFNKEAPLHDGAVIIKDERISFASTYFPIGLNMNLEKEFGTRHRAALTISKETDSITIIVSEETGNVSIAFENRLYKNLEESFFVQLLTEKLNGSQNEKN